MRPKYLKLIVLVGALTTVPSLGYSQSRGNLKSTADRGEHEYAVSCAVCHGVTGKGDGPYVAQLKKSPADLTRIQRDNMGVFPFDRMYEVIDGRKELAAHGTREMPIWGEKFKQQAGRVPVSMQQLGYYNSFVRGRIIALIGYIYTLQQK